MLKKIVLNPMKPKAMDALLSSSYWSWLLTEDQKQTFRWILKEPDNWYNIVWILLISHWKDTKP